MMIQQILNCCLKYCFNINTINVNYNSILRDVKFSHLVILPIINEISLIPLELKTNDFDNYYKN